MGGVVRYEALVVLGVSASLLSGGCGDGALAPEDELVFQTESEHFRFYWAPGDPGVDVEWQERHFAWAVARLQLEAGEPVTYHKYRDRAHLEAVTGHRQGTGFAEAGAGRMHSIWPRDNHEYIHVVFNRAFGTPPPLFSEGVAVAHHGASLDGSFDGDPRWNGQSVHDLALQLHRSGELPDLSEIAASDGFYDFDGQLTYPVAGSFVRFLIDDEGIDLFKGLVERTGGPGDGLDSIREDFVATYGATLGSVQARWLAFLTARGA